MRLIRGKKGTRVDLTILRQGEKTERFQVAIERDTIDLDEQAAKLRYETVVADDRKLKIAVLDLPSFYGDQDPSQAQGLPGRRPSCCAQARDSEADGLLLDLSRNGGGLLEDAVAISGFFIREGGVVAVKESDGQEGRVLPDPDDGILFTGPMVILISRLSASASEILAGALKDYRRALIVGDDHTFGKGTVQSVFPLRPGLGALKITTALFFRPGGASTQNSGVAADVVFPSLLNTDAFGERHKRHSLSAEQIPPFRGDEANGDDERDAVGAGHPADGRRAGRKVEAPGAGERVLPGDRRESWRSGRATMEWSGSPRSSGSARRPTGGAEAPSDDPTRTGEAGSADADTAGVAVPTDSEEDADPSPQIREALEILTDMITLSP